MTYQEALELAGKHNATIFDAFVKAKSVLDKHERIMCSVSGGKDSDIMLDMIYKTDEEKKVRYVWFYTGVEWNATKRHLDDLEQKYDIKIERVRAKKTIPVSCREHGQPFVSKHASEMIGRLQARGFEFKDKPFDVLNVEYPRLRSALSWWCNQHSMNIFNICQNKWLKEFIINNPPPFMISAKCCSDAKKSVSRKYEKINNIDLLITGIRKAEGGIRSAAYRECYNSGKTSHYRPLFWFTNADEEEYGKLFGVTHSDCYTKMGMKRTGCIGCPFNRNVEEELRGAEPYEPQLVKAARHIFKESYEYTRQYREFCAEMNRKEKEAKDPQIKLDI